MVTKQEVSGLICSCFDVYLTGIKELQHSNIIHPYRPAGSPDGGTLALSGLPAEANEPQDKGKGVETQDRLLLELEAPNKDKQVELSQQSPPALTTPSQRHSPTSAPAAPPEDAAAFHRDSAASYSRSPEAGITGPLWDYQSHPLFTGPGPFQMLS